MYRNKKKLGLKLVACITLFLTLGATKTNTTLNETNGTDKTRFKSFINENKILFPNLNRQFEAQKKDALSSFVANFGLMVSSSPVNLAGSTADWFPILNGANFDPIDDTQANRADVDLVGDVDNPLIYFHYYDGGTPGEANDSDDFISVRWRLGAEGTGGGAAPRITIYTLVGVDANLDGVLDCFISFDGGAGTKRTEIVGTGTGANNSPSTSSFEYTRNTVNTPYASYDWSVVFASASTYAETTNYDLDSDGKTDVFVSTRIPFTHLKNYLANFKGINITINTTVRYIAVTATQANSLNGDFGGVHDKNGDLNATWADLLAFSVPMSISEPFSTILDSDGDGIPDYLDIDDDNDGILDIDEGDDDTDGDGIINRLDLDSDGDGISDNIEGHGTTYIAPTGIDTDGDGLDNAYDSNNGGTPLPLPNTDGTGLPDFLDIDSDGDGIRDSAEGTSDFDADGSPNYRDTDSDNDGISDNIEAQTSAAFVAPSGTDTDGDGLDNSYDPDNGGAFIVLSDFDGDGKYDYLDLDSDNDGIRDSIEGNGNPDVDVNANFRDTDSDNDGILDRIEAQGNSGVISPSGNDTDNDGLDDAFDEDNGGVYLAPVDTDSDSFPDYIDIDSDGDGIRDSIESTTDFDGDGIPNYRDSDSDNDSISDNVEAQTSAAYVAPSGNDTDGDGLDNSYDPDNGGAFIALSDFDVDGKFDYLDLDSDNDGIRDSIEGTGDPDNDNLPNFRDLDSDGDGIPDLVEAQTTVGFVVPSGTDTDNDGLDNTFDADNGGVYLNPIDTDNDTTPDYLDLDSDNDTLTDTAESGLPVLTGLDSDNDGLDNAIDTNDAAFGPVNGSITNPSTDLANSDGTGDVDFRSGGYPVSGYVYSDANHSFTKEIEESGTGETLYAKLIQNGVTVHQTTVNTITGLFSFSAVLFGTYNLIIDTNNNAGDVTATKPTQWIGTELGELSIPALNVNNYELTGIHFGLYHGSKITLRALNDNGIGAGTAYNAIQDGSEAYLNFVEVTLKNQAETITIDSKKTNAEGSVTLWIPHTFNNLTVVTQFQNPTGFESVSSQIGNTSGTYDRNAAKLTFVSTSGTEFSGVLGGFVSLSRLEIAMQRELIPGSVTFIPQLFTANSSGTVTFSEVTTPSPVVPGWSSMLYVDTNANGVLDTGENVVSAPIYMEAGEVIHFLIKHTVPASAPIGGRAIVEFTALHSFDGTSPLIQKTYALTNLIQVNYASSAGLELVKQTNKTNALPGEQITYIITFKNVSSDKLSQIVINDETPAYTRFTSASYGTLPNNLSSCAITNPGVGNKGSITWVFTGELASGASSTVSFTVEIES